MGIADAKNAASQWTAGLLAETSEAGKAIAGFAVAGAVFAGFLDVEIQNVAANGLLASILGAHIGLLGVQIGAVAKAAAIGAGVGVVGTMALVVREVPARMRSLSQFREAGKAGFTPRQRAESSRREESDYSNRF